nr:DNA polymerase eta-like [Leptinotarsa decemlineata]
MYFTDRVIVLVDIDCFYCQVEEQLNPNLQNKPVAVVQYNTWREGGIIAANYLAREKGVTKGLWCYEAKEKCPEILFATVSQIRGRADLTKYREAGKQVANVLQAFTSLLERASVDEAYLDITEEVNKRLTKYIEQISLDKLPNTHVVGYVVKDFLDNIMNSREFSESNYKLAMGALIAEEIRRDVFEKTGYRCSAGIAHNKILAKLACGLNKPNAQTIFPQESVIEYFKNLPLEKIKSLGGKFGKNISEELQILHIGELMKFTEKELIQKFEEKTGKWLYNIARGVDLEPVKSRIISKSISCCKRFPGKNCLISSGSVEKWMNELALEISERLEKDMEENSRKAKQIVISFSQFIGSKNISGSKTISLNSYEHSKIREDCLNTIRKFCSKSDGTFNNITYLGLSSGNFQNLPKKSSIKSFLNNSNNIFQKILDKNTDEDTNVTSSVIHSDDQKVENEQYNVSSQNPSCTEEWKWEPFKKISDANEYSHCSTDIELEDITNIEKEPESFFNEYFKSNSIINETFDNSFHNETTISETELEKNVSLNEEQVLQTNESIVDNLETNDMTKVNDNEKCVSHLDEEYASSSTKIHQKSGIKNAIESKSMEHKEKQLDDEKVRSQGVKRKSGQSVPLLEFLKKYDDLNEDNSEYCSECKKRIKLEDITFHSDYHMARKLHHQINYSHVEKETEQSSKRNCSLKTRNNKKKSEVSILKYLNMNIP